MSSIHFQALDATMEITSASIVSMIWKCASESKNQAAFSISQFQSTALAQNRRHDEENWWNIFTRIVVPAAFESSTPRQGNARRCRKRPRMGATRILAKTVQPSQRVSPVANVEKWYLIISSCYNELTQDPKIRLEIWNNAAFRIRRSQKMKLWSTPLSEAISSHG